MRNKIIYTVMSVSVIFICVVVLLLVWLLPLLTATNNTLSTATEFALDHTPLQHVEDSQIYTGDPSDVTVTGTDSLGRTLYVFVRHHEATIVYQDQTVPESRAIDAVHALHLPIASIVSVIPGLIDKNLDTPLSNKASGNAVWQVTARLADGGFLFAYVDMYTGKLFYDFQTNHIPQVE